MGKNEMGLSNMFEDLEQKTMEHTHSPVAAVSMAAQLTLLPAVLRPRVSC